MQVVTISLELNFMRSRMAYLIVLYKIFFDRLSMVLAFVRDLFVIRDEFSDLDVGTVRRVHLSASRKVQGDNEWTLKKVLWYYF